MVRKGSEGALQYAALEMALGFEQVDESSKKKVRSFMEDPEVVSIYQQVKKSLEASPNWKTLEYKFYEHVVDVVGDPPSTVKANLKRMASFLEEETDPACSKILADLLGVSQTRIGVDPRSGEGRLLKVEKGIEIRAADLEWLHEDGVYVGKSHKDHGVTIYQREFVGQLDHEKVRGALKGQKLYVLPEDLEDAVWLIKEFELEAGKNLAMPSWKQVLQKGCSKAMSLSMTGVVLKLGIQCRPGQVGNLARALPCCALETFQRQAQELLPLPLPELDELERSLEKAIEDYMRGDVEMSDEAWKTLNHQAQKLGVKTWTWLQVFVLNYMYCQGVGHRMLTEGMLHSRRPTEAQKHTLEMLNRYSQKWLEDEEMDCISADVWEKAAEELGDMYTGPNVGKSFPLTLEAIVPTTPGAGEAARIPLSEVVSEGVKPLQRRTSPERGIRSSQGLGIARKWNLAAYFTLDHKHDPGQRLPETYAHSGIGEDGLWAVLGESLHA